MASHPFTYTSTNITDPNAGSDEAHGDAGDDILFGQQGGDTMFGDDGDDDLIGGHNVAARP